MPDLLTDAPIRTDLVRADKKISWPWLKWLAALQGTVNVMSAAAGVDSIAKQGSAKLTGDVTLSAGSNVTLTQAGQNIQIAASGSGSVLPSTNDFRATLSPGNPIYAPQNNTPSSTDTTADTVTFGSAHGWTTGTIAAVSVSSGGLTAGTKYFVNVVSSTTVSFHTTVAAAEAGTSKVDLTASVATGIVVSGASRTSVFISPYIGKSIALYDGSAWNLRTSAEFSLALGTLTSGKQYSIFVYDNAGTPTAELGSAWSADTQLGFLPPDCTTQDGVLVKTGDATRRFIGALRTDSTTTTILEIGGIISQDGGKAFLVNLDNALPLGLHAADATTSWVYNTNAWRQSQAAAGNKIEFIVVRPHAVEATFVSVVAASSGAVTTHNAIGLDTTTVPTFSRAGVNNTGAATLTADFKNIVTIGYHFLAMLESGNGTATSTFVGNDVSGRFKSWMTGKVWV